MDEQLKEIAAFVAKRVRSYETRLQLALDVMDESRCSLRMADSALFDEIVDKVEEWCEDNDYSVDFYQDWDDLIEGDEGIIWIEV